MKTEIAIALFFVALAAVSHYGTHRRDLHEAVSKAGKTWRALIAACVICAPHVFWDAGRDYLIHLVVYSGAVLGH